jgi:hypothetical protein
MFKKFLNEIRCNSFLYPLGCENFLARFWKIFWWHLWERIASFCEDDNEHYDSIKT